jgi:hypothetical protein
MAFPILHGAKDFFAEKTISFRLLRAVIDGFGLGYLAVRPFSDFLRRSNADLYRIEIV